MDFRTGFTRTGLAIVLMAVQAATALAETRFDTAGFVGIALHLGQPKGDHSLFAVTAGLRRTAVTAKGAVTGAELSVSVDPFHPRNAQVRALGLMGNDDVTGNLGGGWDFGTDRALASLGLQSPHIRLLADFDTSLGFAGLLVDVNSADRIKRPAVAAKPAPLPPPPPPPPPCRGAISPVC